MNNTGRLSDRMEFQYTGYTLSQMVVTLIILFPSAPLCGKGSLFAGQPDTFPENAVQALPNLFLPPSTS